MIASPLNVIRFLFFFSIVVLMSCGPKRKPVGSGTITIFHAGSLSYPFEKIIKAFNKEYPYVKVLAESSGSLAGARKLTELKRSCDVFASADYKIIEQLLFPDYANWYIAFARNELAVAFSEKSAFSKEIRSENWHEILLRPTVRYGRSDPNADPCGYRSLLMWQLAELYYQRPGLSSLLIKKDDRFVRPKEVDLLALLETGTVDYIFIYRSVAMQHGLKFISLPDSINLGNPALEEHYSQAFLYLRGLSPGEKMTVRGEPMIYAVTIPLNAKNQEPAQKFVAFLLDPEKGGKIMEECGQPAVKPLFVNNPQKIPDALKFWVHNSVHQN